MIWPIGTLTALLLGGCAVPDLGPRPEMRAAATIDSGDSIRGADAAWPTTDWWQSLGDPQLSSLIATALEQSPDVATAAARVRSANALVEQAGAARLPSLTVDGLAGGTKQSQNQGIPPQFVPDGIIDTGRLTASFAFNLDLWGRNLAALRAARGEAAAARVDAAQARLMLSADIASAYADLAKLYAERDVAEGALGVRRDTARIVDDRVRAGLENQGARAQALARVPAASADLTQIDELITLTRHRLAAFAGQGPDFGARLTRPTLHAADVGVPADARIDLVGRRPDLVAARLRADAAAQRIRVARADFYPNITLGAIVGLQSLGLDNLLRGSSSYGNAAPAFSLPIFDGGRIAGRYRGARADYDSAVAHYDQVLLMALRETADTIASRAANETMLDSMRASVVANREAARIARLRYGAGLSNQLPVLQAEDALLASQRSVADLEARRITLSIALMRALGGGFATPPEPAGTH